MGSKKGILLGVLFLVLLAWFFYFQTNGVVDIDTIGGEVGGTGEESMQEIDWMEVILKDVRTQENFKINDFSDKPILLESFAVWCPTCTQQQKIIRGLHEEIGEDFVSISLDTDPNENEGKILEHITRNGFDWYYAISPIDLTKALIVEFGPGFVVAPSAPVVLICPNGSFEKLPSGVKTSTELKTFIEGC